MANTKNIENRQERKAAKRAQRKALSQTKSDLTAKQIKAYRKSETVGLRAWIAEQEASD